MLVANYAECVIKIIKLFDDLINLIGFSFNCAFNLELYLKFYLKRIYKLIGET